jgi:hypothetical protein
VWNCTVIDVKLGFQIPLTAFFASRPVHFNSGYNENPFYAVNKEEELSSETFYVYIQTIQCTPQVRIVTSDDVQILYLVLGNIVFRD